MKQDYPNTTVNDSFAYLEKTEQQHAEDGAEKTNLFFHFSNHSFLYTLEIFPLIYKRRKK